LVSRRGGGKKKKAHTERFFGTKGAGKKKRGGDSFDLFVVAPLGGKRKKKNALYLYLLTYLLQM